MAGVDPLRRIAFASRGDTRTVRRSMPKRGKSRSGTSEAFRAEYGRVRARSNRCVAVLVIDNVPLQNAAWAELVRARKRLEKASREIHRHEEADEPGFRSWLANTFPTLLSAVRELAQKVEAKGRIVEAVEAEAYFTGRPPAKVWRAMQNPPAPDETPRRETRPAGDRPAWENAAEDSEDDSFEEMKRRFEREFGEGAGPFFETFWNGTRAPAPSTDEADARAIYRRLVQHLHPDRGGEWTPARARLWEQVQEAWQRGDADWLARLEAEWEASADLLGPTSAVGRLRSACREIDAARRDAERRVREYRKQPSWRFSVAGVSAIVRLTIERQLRRDEETLRFQLEDLEAAIARWERASTRGSRGGRRARSTVAWQDEMPLY